MSAPDVIVAWLQNDYGKLGRAGDAIAHALVQSPAAGRVAYVEPFVPAPGEPQLGARNDRGLLVFSGSGTPPTRRPRGRAGRRPAGRAERTGAAQLRGLAGELVAALRVHAGVLANRARDLRQARRVGRDGSPQGSPGAGPPAADRFQRRRVRIVRRVDRRRAARQLCRPRRRPPLARSRGRLAARAARSRRDSPPAGGVRRGALDAFRRRRGPRSGRLRSRGRAHRDGADAAAARARRRQPARPLPGRAPA